MKFAWIIDPLETLKPHKDTSLALMEAAEQLGHENFCTQAMHLEASSDGVTGLFSPVKVDLTASSITRPGEQTRLFLHEFDGVIMRKDPPFNAQYLHAVQLLSQAESEGALVVNNPKALSDWNEKLAILRVKDLIAPTLVSASMASIKAFWQEMGDIIVKPLDAMGGAGIFRIRPEDTNANVILETLTHKGTVSIMAQKFIAEIAQGDKRILFFGDQIYPYALARIPAMGENRGNMVAGASTQVQPLSQNDWQLVRHLHPLLQSQKLFFVGIDVIGNYLTEINHTSPTGVQELSKATGEPLAQMIIHELAKFVHRQRSQLEMHGQHTHN